MTRLAKAPDTRRRDLAQIHLALKQIGLCDADHRALLQQLHGVDSSSKLNARQRGQYIAHLKKLGFKPAPPKSRATSNIDRRLDTSPEMRKARAIWLMLHAIGVVRDPSESALVAWGKRMGKVDDLQWQRRPDMLVEGLKTWAMRHLPAIMDARLIALKWPFESIQDDLKRENLLTAFNQLRNAQLRGVIALFDYYWPIWEILQTVSEQGDQK
jgi:phage gp16-like protein